MSDLGKAWDELVGNAAQAWAELYAGVTGTEAEALVVEAEAFGSVEALRAEMTAHVPERWRLLWWSEWIGKRPVMTVQVKDGLL